MYDYDDIYDEGYDYGDRSEPIEYPHPPSWQPRDAVIAWQTTPYWANTRHPDRRRG